MSMLKRRFVAIRWLDAHCISGATEMSEDELPHAPAIYTLYGFVLRDDEVGITVAAEESDHHTYRGLGFIPRGMIESVVELSVKPKKLKAKAPEPPAAPTSPE